MSDVLPKRVLAGHERPAIRVAPLLLEAAALDAAGVYARLETRAEGLRAAQAALSSEARQQDNPPPRRPKTSDGRVPRPRGRREST